MKFSVNYQSKYKIEADEIRCPINQLGTIFSFVKEHPEKRYNIILSKDIAYDKMIEQINFIKEIAEDYTIEGGNISIISGLIDSGYNAYLRFPVCDWESFNNIKGIGVSDIYIDGPLGFQIDAIAKGKDNIKIRFSPTVSPNANLSIKASNANAFFIRPEDIALYESALDIVDFKTEEQEKEDTLYQIYKRGTFNFNLEQLIEHLHMTVPNLFIRPEFAKERLNCGQRCNVPGKSCHLCETQFTITNSLLNYIKESN